MPYFSWLNSNILALGFVSLFSDFGSEMATAVLPAFLISIGGSAAILGIIEGFANASNSFMSIAAGWASDYTAQRKPFAAFGYFLAALGIGSLYGAHRWIVLLAGRVLLRIGKGVREPARDALLASSAAAATYGRVFGFQRMMDTLGAIFGPLVALVLIRVMPIRMIFLIAAVPVLFSCIIIAWFVKEVTVVKPSKITLHMHHFSKMPREFLYYCIAAGIFGLGNCAASLLVLRAIKILTPIIGITFADWYSIALYTLFNIFYAAFSYPVGILADRIGKRRMLVCGYLLTGIGLLGFAYSIAQLWYVSLLFLVMGIAYAIVDGVQRAYAADLLPHEIRGTGYGILAGVAGIGNLFSSIMVGFLWTTISPVVGFGFAAVMCLLGAMLLFSRKWQQAQ